MTETTLGLPDMDQAIAAFQAAGGVQAEIETQQPPSNEVALPAGFITKSGELFKTAEIRELNGSDEEAMAKAGSATKSLQVAFQRGLVSIGDVKPTLTELDAMLTGDRDAVLLGIRIATFGETVTYPVVCVSCATEQNITIDLVHDVEVDELEDPVRDRVFSVNAKAGEIVVALPNGVTQKKLVDSDEKTTAEMFTDILAGCIVSVDGSPSMGRSTALNLSMADRTLLVTELSDRTPGPRLGEVSKTCEACDSKINLSLSLVDLFRL